MNCLSPKVNCWQAMGHLGYEGVHPRFKPFISFSMLCFVKIIPPLDFSILQCGICEWDEKLSFSCCILCPDLSRTI